MTQPIRFKFYHPLFLMLIPAVAMTLSDAVQWSWFDFIVMGSLLLVLGLSTSFILKKWRDSSNKWLYVFGVIFLFLVFWAELAVGIFGSPLAGH
jgi:hypothetical protein